jgi:hypothetical protein
MTQIRRFEMIAVTRCGEGWQELQREPEGDWVPYEDHIAAMDELRTQLSALQQRHEGAVKALRKVVERIDLIGTWNGQILCEDVPGECQIDAARAALSSDLPATEGKNG